MKMFFKGLYKMSRVSPKIRYEVKFEVEKISNVYKSIDVFYWLKGFLNKGSDTKIFRTL